MKPGDRVRLPDAAPTRKNAKPKQRFGTICKQPYHLPGRVLVEKSDRPGEWWIPEALVNVIQD